MVSSEQWKIAFSKEVYIMNDNVINKDLILPGFIEIDFSKSLKNGENNPQRLIFPGKEFI